MIKPLLQKSSEAATNNFIKETTMDLNQAIEKHAEWKVKFRKAISGQETMDAETIA
jgi:hypothetical protein